MDPRHPTTARIIHEPFDGEALRREREFAGGPCPFHPSHFINGLVVSVIVIAIGAALYAANAAQGVPV